MEGSPRAPENGDRAARPRHLVITVHGIRTFGEWQDGLRKLLKREPIEVYTYRYGYFSSIAFMIPISRWIVTRQLRSALIDACRSHDWDRIDLVGHSFGTHLLAWGLHGIPAADRPKVNTVILAGSVLKPTFPWGDLMPGCVHRVVNECGTRDNILVLNQIAVLLTGMAGRVGFTGMNHDRFRNRFFPYRHSEYFVDENGDAQDEFMKKWWIPLLTGEDARALLAPVYEVFTEGPDTTDLQEAAGLLG